MTGSDDSAGGSGLLLRDRGHGHRETLLETVESTAGPVKNLVRLQHLREEGRPASKPLWVSESHPLSLSFVSGLEFNKIPLAQRIEHRESLSSGASMAPTLGTYGQMPEVVVVTEQLQSREGDITHSVIFWNIDEV